MSDIKITIDGKEVELPIGSTILQGAQKLGIHIPTLCHLDLHDIKMVNQSASCRVCVVEVEGRRNLAPACATPVTNGMVIRTNSIKVLNARKTVVELLISDHPKECLTCSKSGHCELQDLSEKMGIRNINITGNSMSTYKKEYTTSIIREMDKCIMCRRCETMCNNVQTVGVLSGINRGFDAVVAPAFDEKLEDTVCTHCGQCVAVCPVGALSEEDSTWRVVEALADPEKVVVVQTAPATRVALGEAFGLEPGTVVTGEMVAALRRLGFNYVFDTDFAADLTIMEEGTELLGRLDKYLAGEEVALPILTSCCPAWVNFIESQYHELIDIPSSARSPQQMFGAVAKTYFAEKLEIPREKLVVVSIMPCLAKKFEASREEFSVEGNPDVDIVLSTRELAHLIKRANLNLKELEKEEYDNPLGISTGAGLIFGVTGGVLEAALRTSYEIKTGKTLEKIEFEQVRGFDGLRVASVDLGGITLNVGLAHGLGNARDLLDEIKDGNPRNLHAIEVMACPGGCIGGAGQPYHHGDVNVLKKRTASIYSEEKNLTLRKSHENPAVKELYETYLGKPMSEKAHHLLHTHYSKKEKY
ncbi:NAD(P)-dependent iron-only hydrogenase catalytic subunit [Natranaerovirga pectinivora]|uniref:NAD(P)-dependent iron-only hydrogenase catalytic subunit n=1 Tax=Natranaerovirga pectinivora TaxID=682400 RepID=A0A4V2V037_9FIRM|nr:NADH-dependent [FeFe] hydrogenase, group A6 [Natranaerovirga pectinivora]TCT13802.1 NAD(P)-dependent iron-only hydrogenase catalytic subunit [Natranaerovirga pectinivora]